MTYERVHEWVKAKKVDAQLATPTKRTFARSETVASNSRSEVKVSRRLIASRSDVNGGGSDSQGGRKDEDARYCLSYVSTPAEEFKSLLQVALQGELEADKRPGSSDI
ncbi:hypothetical protein ACMFMF_003297 [Clarireedia jacksonii]